MSNVMIAVICLSGVVAAIGAVIWCCFALIPEDDDDPGEQPAKPAAAPPRDISIGKDQYVGERLNGLRRIQQRSRDEESRRALERIKRGW